MEELAAEIREVLPQLEESEMTMLMRFLADNGVRSKYDMCKMEPIHLSDTLTSADAEKLVDYFKNAGERTTATPSSPPQEMEELFAEIRRALPNIEQRRVDMLMKHFAENGVHCKDDTSKVQPVDLVNALGTDNAKKLVAHFERTRTFHEDNSAKFTAEGFKDWQIYKDLKGKLDEDHAQRLQIHEETLRDIGNHALQRDKIWEATEKNLQTTQMCASQAHEEWIRKQKEEERLRTERYAQMESEMDRPDGNSSVPGTFHEDNAGNSRDITFGQQDAERQPASPWTLPEVTQDELAYGKIHAATVKDFEESRKLLTQATDEQIRKIQEIDRQRVRRQAQWQREDMEAERRRMERSRSNPVQSVVQNLTTLGQNIYKKMTRSTPAAHTPEAFPAPNTATYGNAYSTQTAAFSGPHSSDRVNRSAPEGPEHQSSRSEPAKTAPSYQY